MSSVKFLQIAQSCCPQGMGKAWFENLLEFGRLGWGALGRKSGGGGGGAGGSSGPRETMSRGRERETEIQRSVQRGL